jgi:sialidase-1
MTKYLSLSLSILLFFTSCTVASQSKFEGPLKPFLSEAKMDIQQVFKGNRFPNVVVSTKGTVLAIFNGVKVKRSEDGGVTWGPEILVSKGFMPGGHIVNETTGEILVFIESRHPPAKITLMGSQDDGKTWTQKELTIKPNSKGHMPSMHMNEAGITLRHGKYAGRLIRCTRYYAGQNAGHKWPEHYTNAIFSDDHGKTWQASEPFGENGTGEATLAELSDGSIYYNSRRHWAPKGKSPLRRWVSSSVDGGATWAKPRICQVLPDGPQNNTYGLMGGLVRLPVAGKDILIFSNIVSQGGRQNGYVWASFDGGKTWPIKRLVDKGAFGYSSMNAGRPGTASEGWIYLLYESAGAKMAKFNLSWVLGGEKTGDGEVPEQDPD